MRATRVLYCMGHVQYALRRFRTQALAVRRSGRRMWAASTEASRGRVGGRGAQADASDLSLEGWEDRERPGQPA